MKLKYTWIPFIFAALFFVPLKLYVVISGTYPSLGAMSYKYIDGISDVMASLFVVMIIIMCLMSKNVQPNMNFRKNIFSGVLSALSGIIITYGGVSALIFAINMLDNRVLVLAISSILAGLVFLLMSFTHFTASNIFKKVPLLILFPVLWCGIRIFLLFIDYTAVVSTQIDASYMLALMSLFVFLFMESRAFVHVDFKSIVKKMIIFGMPSVILLLAYSLSDIISTVNSSKFVFDYTFVLVIADALLALYTFFVLIEATSLQDDDSLYYEEVYTAIGPADYDDLDENLKSRIVPDSMTRSSKKFVKTNNENQDVAHSALDADNKENPVDDGTDADVL